VLISFITDYEEGLMRNLNFIKNMGGGGTTEDGFAHCEFSITLSGYCYKINFSRGQLKYDGTRAETRFRLFGETEESI
jgi:hypothetical protein